MEASSSLLVERRGAVTVLTMNRPGSRNALSRDLVLALIEATQSIATDKSVRAVILTGAGGSFCAGADLRTATGERAEIGMNQRIDEFHAIVKGIVHAPQPYVAAVDGAAVGFGADLALACDLRVLSTRGYIQEKFTKIGLMPDGGGTFWMARLVGIGRALEYLMLGTKLEAGLALELGLANRVVEPSDLSAEAGALAEELAKGPPLAYAKIKTAVRESFKGTIDDALVREKAGQIELLETEDMLEGVMAWAQRREPEFKGR